MRSRLLPGFTLVEMLAVLAVAGVLFSVAAPSLALALRNARVSGASMELLSGLLLARSEAMKRGLRVVMCKSQEGEVCAASGGWQQGWIVFVDANGDGRRGPGETLLRAQPALAASLRLTGTSPVASYVSYTPTGATKLAGGGFQAGTLTLCEQSLQPASGRHIVINATGRPRTQKVQVASCP